ncbi:glycoside hydrolase family 25 protein [Polychaeton citri CBS 116435]|uniref:N,O-diacetylmuramidase n=1 Tax=Polychaeton citri CBS 116435 TaxID=1314669 RepID=A0A9P4Q8J5_9PEZI|nr:glycoside hydrolase family 25 protein [Polychaeton citri CBS 116435]
MKVVAAAALLLSAAFAAPSEKRASTYGFDVSHYQSSVDWSAAYNTGGLRFVYIKATEGTTYKDPKFGTHYDGATNAGFIRGGYHFASGSSSATAQAKFFYQNGGGWTKDGITLPGMLDLEGDCISTSWIKEFSDEYHSLSGRYPVLYSSPSWWSECTGGSSAFVNTNPLMMACWSSSPCTPQGGWPYYTIWQYADSNKYGGDSDVFSGSITQLKKLATG